MSRMKNRLALVLDDGSQFKIELIKIWNNVIDSVENRIRTIEELKNSLDCQL